MSGGLTDPSVREACALRPAGLVGRPEKSPVAQRPDVFEPRQSADEGCRMLVMTSHRSVWKGRAEFRGDTVT